MPLLLSLLCAVNVLIVGYLIRESRQRKESERLRQTAQNSLVRECAELSGRIDALNTLHEDAANRIEALRINHVSVKEMGDACMARMDRETVKLAEPVIEIRDEVKGIRSELIDIVKLNERDQARIAELEQLVKDATLDTAVSALEDRVAKLESAPAVATPQGRRGGSAWGPHQIAASAGAVLRNGVENPIPTPGVS